MPRYFAFLRGINLGKRRLSMADLQTQVEKLGHGEVSTFIASGNVVFTSTQRSAVKLETELENHFAKNLGYAVDTFIRTEDELVVILQQIPFARKIEPQNTFAIGLWKQPPATEIIHGLRRLGTPVDEFQVIGRELYWLTAEGMTQSQAWDTPAMRALKLPTMTVRNRNTLQRMAEKYGIS